MPTESNAGERPAAMSECNECNEALAEARRVIAEQRRLAMIAEQAIVKRDLTGARSTLRALMTQSLHRTPARNPVVPLRGIQHGFGFTGKVLNHLPGPLPSAVPFTAPSAAVTGLSGVVAIAAGSCHVCALLGGGTVECWGCNGTGELGDGSTTDSLTPVTATGLNGAVAIAAASSSSCAVLSDGTVKCWGQTYPGVSQVVPTPTAIPSLTGVTSISSSPDTTCVVVSGGRIECWGFNNYGQLGNGVVAGPSATPVTVVSGS